MGIEDGRNGENNNIVEFPGMESRMVLGEIKELLPKVRRIIVAGRLNVNKVLKDRALGEANANELSAKYDAMEHLCNTAESVARALKEDVLNRFLLHDAEAAKSNLEAAFVQAGG